MEDGEEDHGLAQVRLLLQDCGGGGLCSAVRPHSGPQGVLCLSWSWCSDDLHQDQLEAGRMDLDLRSHAPVLLLTELFLAFGGRGEARPGAAAPPQASLSPGL